MIAVGAMMFVFGLGVLVLAILAEIFEWECSNTALGFIAGAILMVGLCVMLAGSDKTPTAMDVYQGKTTLKYTVVDSVKVDSTVVWKPKE